MACTRTATVAATDDDLIGRWRAGDASAGQALFVRYFDAIYRYFRSRCRAEADDLVQATFCACLQARMQFRGEATFRTYLFAIARHQLCRALRERRRASSRAVAALAWLPEPSPLPPAGLARAQDQLRLTRLLRELPPRHRALLELHYWDELEIDALRERLGAPAGTIRGRLHRARKQLRALVESDRR